MAQRLILIHGRSTKPAERQLESVLKRALIQGIARVDQAKADRISSGDFPVDFVYYGDINNALLQNSATHRNTFTHQDPDHGNAPCISPEGYAEAVDALGQIKSFNKTAYRKIIRENKDLRWVDDAARAVSTLAAIFTLNTANRLAISAATSDMGHYLLTRATGSKVRTRLRSPLEQALLSGDDICLVSHSMGCIVSYDVLWKFSRMSEYTHVQGTGNKVNLWLTLGCPLGEAGVRHNLYDAHERSEDRLPRNIIKDWLNIAAHDDFISHDPSMAGDFREMKKRGFLDSITDKRIYNCYTKDGKSNPHKFHGYLAHDLVGKSIADWMA